MNPILIEHSPRINRIYAGRAKDSGTSFLFEKYEVTSMACGAVAEHVLANGEPVTVLCNGKPAFLITVERIEEGGANKKAPLKGKLLHLMDGLDNCISSAKENGDKYGEGYMSAMARELKEVFVALFGELEVEEGV